MIMNEHKICFIICTNNVIFSKECLNYLYRLNIPDGYEVDFLTVNDAHSMLSGYKEGCSATDALYKVFLHHDVFILNTGFIKNIIDIFNVDDNIGMIGMVGVTHMPDSFIMWDAERCGNIFVGQRKADYSSYNYSPEIDGYEEVEAVDGLLLATKGTLRLRDDIFDGWDFYDVSMSYEMRKSGRKIVVPNQIMPWCLHDDGDLLSMLNYNHYRKLAIMEYSDSHSLSK